MMYKISIELDNGSTAALESERPLNFGGNERWLVFDSEGVSSIISTAHIVRIIETHEPTPNYYQKPINR